MSALQTADDFFGLLRQANLVDANQFADLVKRYGLKRQSAPDLANLLVREGVLTNYQAVQVLQGKHTFRIGPYHILERLGFGEGSNVYLCAHQGKGELAAVKVLTGAKAHDPVALQRFFREARAGAKLAHANLVHVIDSDYEGETQFLVMEFVDGSSIQDIVQHFGPMAVERAAEAIRQAALGLQYAHEHGLVHRDLKPGNLLIDRQGNTKILDMGLARFSREEGDLLTQGVVLGAPEYLPPEQAVDSHNVDVRADIYSLGATLYFMITGTPPYNEEKSLAKKLLAKQSHPPTPIRDLRAEVPDDLARVVEKMMAQNPADRYQVPREVALALEPWTRTPMAPPPEREMPQFSPAVQARLGRPVEKPVEKPAVKRLEIQPSPAAQTLRKAKPIPHLEEVTDDDAEPAPAAQTLRKAKPIPHLEEVTDDDAEPAPQTMPTPQTMGSDDAIATMILSHQQDLASSAAEKTERRAKKGPASSAAKAKRRRKKGTGSRSKEMSLAWQLGVLLALGGLVFLIAWFFVIKGP